MSQAQVLSEAADSKEGHSNEREGVQAPWGIIEQ
jgi:hypothetical protein